MTEKYIPGQPEEKVGTVNKSLSLNGEFDSHLYSSIERAFYKFMNGQHEEADVNLDHLLEKIHNKIREHESETEKKVVINEPEQSKKAV